MEKPYRIHGLPEKEMNWVQINNFVMTKTRKVTPSVIIFEQEAKPYKINHALCYMWAMIRTDYFHNRCWYDNMDVANLGGVYQTSREGIREACKEFNKFVDTAMLQEQEQVEKLYDQLNEYCLNKNPDAKDPIVEPPPTPRPIPTPEPVPIPVPPAPGKPTDWKKWLAGIVGSISAIAVVVKIFTPAYIDVIIDAVLAILKTISGG